MADFENRLKGGHPNSLGNTVEIVEEVLKHPELFEELFNCYFSTDEVVRLRTSNAMKRICKAAQHLLLPYIDRMQQEISQIDQASTKWTLSQLFGTLKGVMSTHQIDRAIQIMKHNLETDDDWIVLNTTMETLGQWSMKDEELKNWLIPHLTKLEHDQRKSVAGRAHKILVQFRST